MARRFAISCLFLGSSCDTGEPDPSPSYLSPHLTSSLGDDSHTAILAVVGDTVIIRMRASDAEGNGLRNVAVRVSSSSGMGIVTPARRTTDSTGTAEFYMRLATTIQSEDLIGHARAVFSAGSATSEIDVNVAPAAATQLSISADSLVMPFVYPWWALLPVGLADRYGNRAGSYSAVWASRDSTIAIPRVDFSTNLRVQAVRAGSAWIVGSLCNTGTRYYCANTGTNPAVDSFRVIVVP
jgi:hypothetical protein